MPPISVAILVIQFVVFLIWAFLAFRWLFALRADAVAESGSAFPGPASQLRAFRGGLAEQRYVKYRVRLAVLTLILLTLSLVHYLLSPGGESMMRRGFPECEARRRRERDRPEDGNMSDRPNGGVDVGRMG